MRKLRSQHHRSPELEIASPWSRGDAFAPTSSSGFAEQFVNFSQGSKPAKWRSKLTAWSSLISSLSSAGFPISALMTAVIRDAICPDLLGRQFGRYVDGDLF